MSSCAWFGWRPQSPYSVCGFLVYVFDCWYCHALLVLPFCCWCCLSVAAVLLPGVVTMAVVLLAVGVVLLGVVMWGVMLLGVVLLCVVLHGVLLLVVAVCGADPRTHVGRGHDLVPPRLP